MAAYMTVVCMFEVEVDRGATTLGGGVHEKFLVLQYSSPVCPIFFIARGRRGNIGSFAAGWDGGDAGKGKKTVPLVQDGGLFQPILCTGLAHVACNKIAQ